jgi:NAD(P)-dependent dehydrogenase (short-subunit alcohol dehydrogenase family)
MDRATNPPTTLEDFFGLKGKVALVLGGGLGMGEASAKLLAHMGCDIIIAEILPDRAARVANDVRAMGRRAYEAVGDMCDPAQVDAVLPKAEEALGGVDIVVSIIGEAAWASFLDTSLDDWALDERRNLRYFFYCSQWAARSMVRRGKPGAICAITSVDGLQASPMHGAYGAAKAGLVSLVKTMANELGPHGIRVNCIAPGMIKTPRAVARSSAEAIDKSGLDMGIPLGRGGSTQEIAETVLYLVSDMSRYVTGITLPMDGGWLVTRLEYGLTNRRR